MTLLLILLLPVVAGLAAPFCLRWQPRAERVLVLGPLAGFLLALTLLPQVTGGHRTAWAFPWFPQLGAELGLMIDGLGLLFLLLILGIGVLIVLYAGAYLDADDPRRGSFFFALLSFMGGMVGLVLADNLILLFVCWEITSITSYLLIGFHHEDKSTREKALQALLVTGLGGLAMLAGFILLGQAADSWRLSEILLLGEQIRHHPHYLAILLLILAGAFTKSAQFPFHFWLPNAMAAPTPVSAYLHSATMVKAGVFLLARLSPVLGETFAWNSLLVLTGAATFLIAVLTGIRQSDLKRILAFTTLAVLGLLTLLIGLGSELAMQSALVFLSGHALYKAALFMVAGNIDLGAGTRDITLLAGLRAAMPWTAAAGGLAALSKAGFPPFFGFIGKEYVYKTSLAFEAAAPILVALTVVGNGLLLFMALVVGIQPFWGRRPVPDPLPHPPHEGPVSLWLPPLLLAILGLLAGLFPGLLAAAIIAPGVSAMAGEPVALQLALWQGINLPLILSVLTVALGLALYRIRRDLSRLPLNLRPGIAETAYTRGLQISIRVARLVTRALQSGSLRWYILLTLGFVGGLLAWKFLRFGGLPSLAEAAPVSAFPVVLCLLVAAGALLAATADSRLTAILGLAAAGFGIALIFAHFSAPDLAITQILVETLTALLFLLVIHRLPPLKRISSPRERLRDAFLAGAFGLLVAWLVFKAVRVHLGSPLASTLVDWSYTQAYGKNVVNVILVDFRALDTLGEITVLAIAALGVTALAGLPRHPSLPPLPPLPRSGLMMGLAARFLLPVFLLLALIALYRGHNLPGGGFIGGLLASCGFLLVLLAEGCRQARRLLRVSPLQLAASGLVVATGSGLLSVLPSLPFATGLWLPSFTLPGLGAVHLGTPLLFDLGVFLTVIGFTLQTAFSLAESD